jgi:hypothetical protein
MRKTTSTVSPARLASLPAYRIPHLLRDNRRRCNNSGHGLGLRNCVQAQWRNDQKREQRRTRWPAHKQGNPLLDGHGSLFLQRPVSLDRHGALRGIRLSVGGNGNKQWKGKRGSDFSKKWYRLTTCMGLGAAFRESSIRNTGKIIHLKLSQLQFKFRQDFQISLNPMFP